jgi:serine/threonine protein phosphatase PrpC
MAAAKPAEPPRYICFLCKRKFKSQSLLSRHKQLSELHRRNILKQDEENQKQKEELRTAIHAFRKQMQDVEVQISKQSEPGQDLQNQRQMLELKLRQAVGEYSGAQEKLEASRIMQIQERTGAGGSGLPKKAEAFETRVGKLLISAGAASWQGNKDVQEDRYILDIQLESSGGERVVGFCVLDGHSGSLCVDALVDWLPRNLQKCLSSKAALTEEHLRSAVHEAILLTDDEFLSKAREREVLDGSTMILCLIYPDDGEQSSRGRTRHRLMIANLGDSRAVLCRAQGGRLSAVRLSDDHKPGRADERRRIESVGGLVDIQGVWRVFTPSPAQFAGRSVIWGLAVSRAFGDLLMKEPQRYGCQGATGELVTAVPELHFYDLHPTEDRFLVLACDGVWDVLGDDDAVAVCIEHRSADLAAHALTRRAFELSSDDNITAVVLAWQLEEEDTDSKRTRTE